MAQRSRTKLQQGEGVKSPGVSSAPRLPSVKLLLSYVEIDRLTDPDERRRCMLERLAYLHELAEARCYANKRGKQIPMPDTATMLRVDEVALEVLGVEPAKPAKKAADLSVFNGGKAADRKVG